MNEKINKLGQDFIFVFLPYDDDEGFLGHHYLSINWDFVFDG